MTSIPSPRSIAVNLCSIAPNLFSIFPYPFTSPGSRNAAPAIVGYSMATCARRSCRTRHPVRTVTVVGDGDARHRSPGDVHPQKLDVIHHGRPVLDRDPHADRCDARLRQRLRKRMQGLIPDARVTR